VCTTDKRTDVWSRNFVIWKINFGLWADAWAGPWEKGVWADSEQLFWVVFSIFHRQKIKKNIFFLHCSVRTEKLHKIKLKIKKKILGKFFITEKPVFFRAKNATVSTLRSGTDYCWLYCVSSNGLVFP
jgi:hypothetical protein